MSNTNCLEGMKCPKCRSEGPFRIVTKCWSVVSDDGVEECYDHDWDVNAPCLCANCFLDATVRQFMT